MGVFLTVRGSRGDISLTRPPLRRRRRALYRPASRLYEQRQKRKTHAGTSRAWSDVVTACPPPDAYNHCCDGDLLFSCCPVPSVLINRDTPSRAVRCGLCVPAQHNCPPTRTRELRRNLYDSRIAASQSVTRVLFISWSRSRVHRSVC